MVAAGAAGVTIEPAEALDTTRRLSTVRFDGAAAEELDAAPSSPRGRRSRSRAPPSRSASPQRAMEMAVDHAKERTQFGRPIGTYQAVSHRCAQMLLEVDGARAAIAVGGLGARPRARDGVRRRPDGQGLRVGLRRARD